MQSTLVIHFSRTFQEELFAFCNKPIHSFWTRWETIGMPNGEMADCSPVSSGVEAVGEEGALSLQPRGAAEVGRLSWLEVVEVSTATAATRQPLVCNLTRLPPLHTLRCRVLQPGDTERLNKPRTNACFSHILVLPWRWVLSLLEFQPSMKSGSGHSACQGRHASTWQRSSARTPQCFSSPPACLSTGLFNTARHANSVIRPYFLKLQNLRACWSHLTSKSTLAAKQNVNRVTAQQFSLYWNVLLLKTKLD